MCERAIASHFIIPAINTKMNDVIDSSDLFVYLSIKLEVNGKAKIYNFYDSRYYNFCMLG